MLRDLRPEATVSTESDLKALVAAAKTLNTSTDAFSEEVSHIESVLNSLNLGLRTHVVVECTPEEYNRWNHVVRLWYDRTELEWGFVIDEFTEDTGDPDQRDNYKSWAFRSAPRALRLKVVRHIPALVRALRKASEEAADEVTKKLAEVKEISSTLLGSAE